MYSEKVGFETDRMSTFDSLSYAKSSFEKLGLKPAARQRESLQLKQKVTTSLPKVNILDI